MSLQLDQRQRAMLREMQIKVWWPQSAAPDAAPEGAQATPGVTVGRQRARPTDAAIAPLDTGQKHPSGDAVGAMDWPALADTISSCAACKLCNGRKAAVFRPEMAARQADWLVVGEPPDEDDERAGAPFAGPEGQLLDNMLRAVHCTRDGTGNGGARLTNVVKCRPAAVCNPGLDELAACAVYLRREIALVQPRVILALGRFAALSLLGAGDPQLAELPLGKLRGRVHRYDGLPVVVSYPPAKLLRARGDKANAWADLCLARAAASAPTSTNQPVAEADRLSQPS